MSVKNEKDEMLNCESCDFKTSSKQGLKSHVTKKHKGKKRNAKDNDKVTNVNDGQKKLKEKKMKKLRKKKKRRRKKKKARIVLGKRETTFVCVLPTCMGSKTFNFCHMDGTIESVEFTTVTVKFEQLGRSATVEHDHLATVRDAEKGVKWKKGDKVHVLQTIEGVDGWWEATIVGPRRQKWKIEWTGQYEEHSDKVQVAGNLIRRAD